MGEIVCVSPFRCRVWSKHARLEEYVTDESCRAEIESLRADQQLVPAIGRRIGGDPLHDVEIICGARRLHCARHLNLQLRVELRELSDREAAVVLEMEGLRESISPYERGRAFSRWLHSGTFASQEQLSHNLRVSTAQVSRLLSLARLPSVIVEAFATPLEIRETWGPILHSLWSEIPRRSSLASTARKLSALSPKLPATEVYSALLSSSIPARQKSRRTRDQIVRNERGELLFRVRTRLDTVAILLPKGNLSAQSIDRITSVLADALGADGHLDASDLSSRRARALAATSAATAEPRCAAGP